MCGKHIAGSSPLLISSIYFKAGPAGILIVCSRAQKGTRKFLELFKMLGVPEIQCTGKRIVANVLIAALGDAVLVLVEDRQEAVFRSEWSAPAVHTAAAMLPQNCTGAGR